MSSQQEDLIRQTKSLLIEIKELGEEQLKAYRKKTRMSVYRFLGAGGEWKLVNGIFMPADKADVRIITSPLAFLYFLVERFWRLFENISENIENPIVQFSIRTEIELSQQIVYYISQSKNKQKNMATKYWLATAGLILSGNTKNKNWLSLYDNLISEIVHTQDQTRFLNLRKRGFPMEEFFGELYRLFPLVTVKNIFQQVEPYLIDIFGRKIKRESLRAFYLWFSGYVHANIFLLKNVETEQDTKGHVFRCVSLLFLIGNQIINIFEDYTKVGIEEPKFDQLLKEVRKIIPLLYKQRKG